MKYFVIFLILIGFTGTIFAVPEPVPEDDFRYSDHVITGKIISSEIIIDSREDNSSATFYDTIIYKVKIEKWHKNPLASDTITVYGTRFPNDAIPEPNWGVVEFDIGDTVYLYLDKTDDGLKFREYGSKLLYSKDSGKTEITSPLKQIKNGVALVDVQCSDGKVPAIRYDKMRVACVSLDTESKLMMRGWATMRLAMPGDNISHALCNNYEGKWHQEYFGCRDITDFQCSLMGGELVDNLSICYNGICPDKLYSLCVTNPNLYIQYPNETEDDFRNRCGPSDTLRGPTPMPTECNSELIECTYVCGDTKRWLFFDEHGFEIDQTTAGMIVDRK